jgi:hypothetical protein
MERDPVVTVGVVGAPYSGIELVLSKNTLPVAQIKVILICKNVPQVSMTNKMTFSKGKMEISLEMLRSQQKYTALRRYFCA